MIGGRHRSNMELVAQDVANVVSPLFGGIPATGAIARTATNVKSGGRTPVAGIVHAVTLLLITLFVGRWASLIPMATLAAILVVVSYHMSEWRAFGAGDDGPLLDRRRIPAGVEVYEINGPFFFGAAPLFKDTIGRIAGRPAVLILRMRHVPALDSTGMRTLRDVVHRTRTDGTVVIIAETQAQPLAALSGSGTMEEIGPDNVVPTLDAALARAAAAVSR